MCLQQLKFVALPVPVIIVIEVLGGCYDPYLGEEEAVGPRGRKWHRSKERWWVPRDNQLIVPGESL